MYFGAEGRRLFGVYHPPASDAERPVGVLLCQPVGQEYIRAHRAFTVLAGRLAERGFHVLRFDYTGCGDSEDPATEDEIAAWQGDVARARDELAEGTGAERLAFVGLRLGAALGALALAGERPADAAVLWDPVPDGGAHLAELRAQHAEWLRGSFAKPAATADEVLGFPLPPSLAAGLERLDLARLASAPARRALIVDTGEREASLAPLAARLESLGVELERCRLEAPPVWLKQEDELGNVLVPSAVLDAQVDWLREVFS